MLYLCIKIQEMIPKQIIEQAIEYQDEKLLKLDNSVIRSNVDIDTMFGHALILSGIRRCGKSTLMQQVRRTVKEQSISLNFEDPRLSGFDLNDFNRLDELIESKNVKMLFLDEIQNVEKWENYVRFKLDEGLKIFITGSNASMLSKELGTKLTGRHLLNELFPFSYHEFLQYSKMEDNTDSLSIYIKNGGFPEYIQSGNDEMLMRLFNDIIIRDIAVRFGLKSHLLLQQLAVYLVSNVGKLITGNGLKKVFGIKSTTTILEYLAFLEDCYLFQYVPKFSYSLKVQQVNAKKCYAIDNGMIDVISLSFNDDLGRKFENLVYLELRRRYDQIFYFSEKKECDFVVYKYNKLADLVQVCYQITSENLTREIDGAIEAMDFFGVTTAKIITFNQEDTFEKDGKTITAITYQKWVM
jgi:hypothetical protein